MTVPNGTNEVASDAPEAVGAPDSGGMLAGQGHVSRHRQQHMGRLQLEYRLAYAADVRIALYQPEIAGNVGAVLRLGACLGVTVDLIEPLGFAWDDKRVRRTAMDYIDHVEIARHAGFGAFLETVEGRRLLLFTTRGKSSAYDFEFRSNDILMFGKESGGVPCDVAARCYARLRIPILPAVRSFNLATSATLAAGEALRQTQGLPL